METRERSVSLIRGADGRLYRVSATGCERVKNDGTLLDDFGVDRTPARYAVDPGDGASARYAIDPGDAPAV